MSDQAKLLSVRAEAGQWSHDALSDLVPEQLTPFTRSNLKDNAEWAYHRFYENIAVDVPYDTHFWALNQGRACLNVALIQTLSRQLFGLTAQDFKYGLANYIAVPMVVGGLKLFQSTGRSQRQMQEGAHVAPKRFERVESWWRKVLTLSWTQADLLRVMEEIERIIRDLLLLHLTTQAAVTGYYLGLGSIVQKAWPNAPASTLNLLFSGIGELPSADAGQELLKLAKAAADDTLIAHFLAAGDWHDWDRATSGRAFNIHFKHFLDAFGHRALNEIEMAQPHWREQPEYLLKIIAGLYKTPGLQPTRPDIAGRRQMIEAEVRSHMSLLQRRTFDSSLREAQGWVRLYDQTRHHLAMLFAGARLWALAAGRDGARDGRLAQVEDIFFLEMEEVKQMMTGEFNKAEQVLPLVESRRTERGAWNSVSGQINGHSETAFAASAGAASGPAYLATNLTPVPASGSVLVVAYPDPGYAPLMAQAAAWVSTHGTPLSPAALVAREYGLPAVVACGGLDSRIISGQLLGVDGDRGSVERET